MISQTVFDQLAPGYDESFTNRVPGKWLRDRVRHRLAALLPAGRVLDVGCGTGDDAIWFATRGHTVVATDVSDGMLEQTRIKCDQLSPLIRERVTIARFDAGDHVDCFVVGHDHDLVLSNFGALNCVGDLQPFFNRMAACVSEGGYVALTLMGRFCVLETLGFALRGDVGRAKRRWSGYSIFESGGLSQPVWYHTPAAVRKMAGDQFELVDLRGIGVAIPPTAFFRLCEKYPRLFRALCVLEKLCSAWWPFNRMGDHYLIVLQKRQAGDKS